MKYMLLAIAFVVTLALAACEGGDDIPEALTAVCTETEDAATDLISVDEPVNGEDVSTPIRVIGDIVPLDGRFWISVVGADGQHIIDYPGRAADTETLTPFELEAPFSVIEDTPACLWVYRLNVEEPGDAVRIPIELVPTADDS